MNKTARPKPYSLARSKFDSSPLRNDSTAPSSALPAVDTKCDNDDKDFSQFSKNKIPRTALQRNVITQTLTPIQRAEMLIEK